MQNLIQHIIIKPLAFLLVFAVLLPAAVKFNHVFEDHKHDVCNEHTTSHIHAIDLDCEFYKFNLNTQYFSSSEFNQISIEENFLKIDNVFYNFIKNYQQLSFSLRGPPFLV